MFLSNQEKNYQPTSLIQQEYQRYYEQNLVFQIFELFFLLKQPYLIHWTHRICKRVPVEWKDEIWGYNHKIELSNDGKWDAAFELTGNKPVGFSIKETPFGKTFYDYPYENPKILLYEDIIDGFIFYKPFYEFTCTRGLPGIVDKKFAKIMIQRLIILGDYNENEANSIQDEIYDWEDFRTFNCADYSKMLEQMNKWLNK